MMRFLWPHRAIFSLKQMSCDLNAACDKAGGVTTIDYASSLSLATAAVASKELGTKARWRFYVLLSSNN